MDESLPLGQIVMGLLGGVALFLFGMEQMTDGLKSVAGNGMKKLLGGLTKNRFLGVITGAVVTAVIQSSSVTTVLVVGFVTTGLMSLAQSVGVIMGANVGTTITAQIVAFKVTKYALVLVFVGFLMLFAGKRDRIRQWGGMIMGLGLIFFGMGLMSDATSPLREYEPFIDVMSKMDNPFLGMIVAAAFTALVQSSSATTGIVIVLASQGFISLEAGIALAFGSNVGTCVTAMLATLGKARPAMRAATVHVLFNVVGVLIWLPFIGVLADMVLAISPISTDLEGTARLAADSPRQIANAHTLFNVANVLIFLPFTVPLARLVERLVPDKPEVLSERAQPKYLEEAFLETPGLAIRPIRLEACRLGELVVEYAEETVRSVRKPGSLEEVRARHYDIGLLYDQSMAYVQRLAAQELDGETSRKLSALARVLTHIEHISEVFSTGLVALVRDRDKYEVPDDPRATVAMDRLLALVGPMVREAIGALQEADTESGIERARAVIRRKPDVQAAVAKCLEQLGSRMDPHDALSLRRFRLQTGVVDLVRQLYYYAKKICKEVVDEDEFADRDDDDVHATMGG